VTAFMMKTDKLTFEKAYENLQTIKPDVKWVLCHSSNSTFVMWFYLRKLSVCLLLQDEWRIWMATEIVSGNGIWSGYLQCSL
jgi:hypothetical protein